LTDEVAFWRITTFAVNPPPPGEASSWSETRGSVEPSLVPRADPKPLWPTSPIHVHRLRSSAVPVSVGATAKPVPFTAATVEPNPQSIPSWSMRLAKLGVTVCRVDDGEE